MAPSTLKVDIQRAHKAENLLQSESWSWAVREGEDWAEDTVGESLKASWQEARDHQAHQEL